MTPNSLSPLVRAAVGACQGGGWCLRSWCLQGPHIYVSVCHQLNSSGNGENTRNAASQAEPVHYQQQLRWRLWCASPCHSAVFRSPARGCVPSCVQCWPESRVRGVQSLTTTGWRCSPCALHRRPRQVCHRGCKQFSAMPRMTKDADWPLCCRRDLLRHRHDDVRRRQAGC